MPNLASKYDFKVILIFHQLANRGGTGVENYQIYDLFNFLFPPSLVDC